MEFIVETCNIICGLFATNYSVKFVTNINIYMYTCAHFFFPPGKPVLKHLPVSYGSCPTPELTDRHHFLLVLGRHERSLEKHSWDPGMLLKDTAAFLNQPQLTEGSWALRWPAGPSAFGFLDFSLECPVSLCACFLTVLSRSVMSDSLWPHGP